MEIHGFKILRILITPTFNTLYQVNFPPLYRLIRLMLQQWKKHHISLLGRIASVKMSILPKNLYLFQTLPITIPNAHLKKLQAELLQYVWNYKWHRIPHSVLMASRSDGGLAFPNLVKYYQAALLLSIASWFTQHSSISVHLLKKLWLAPVHPNNLLWNANVEVDTDRLFGTMSQLRTLWRTLSRQYDLLEKSLLTSFLYNPRMPGSLTFPM